MKTDRIKLLLAVSIALTFLSGIITYYAIQESRKRVEWVFHTYRVIDQGNHVMSLLKDVENDQYRFLISTDSSYLNQQRMAESMLRQAADSLTLLVSDNPPQRDYLAKTILPLITAKKVPPLKGDNGDSLQYHMQRFNDIEISLLHERLDEMNKTHTRQNLTRFVSFILIALTSIIAFITLSKKQKQNDSLISQLKQANETLEIKVKDRTREIARQNENTQELNEKLRLSMEEMESFYEALHIRNEKAEDTLNEIRDLYDNAPCGYHSLAADGTILSMNERELNWLGYTWNEVVGVMNVTQILKPEEHQSYFDDFAKFKALGFIKNKEHTFIRKDGSYFSILLSATAVYGDKGEYRMSRATVVDISDRKLIEEKLVEANKNLVKLNDEKNHFLGIAAHDLKSPLHSILGLINLINLKGNNLTPEQQEYLKYVQRSCIKMQSLIIGLLDINKIEQGATLLASEKIELGSVTQTLFTSFNEYAKTKGINLIMECNAPEKTITTDPDALERILSNLLSNAIKFSPKEKEVVLRIIHNHSIVTFEVIDQGMGISQEDIPKLFKKFQRLHQRPTDGESSTGLGLSIVKELVGALNGKIAVESNVSRGSKFIVELPVS